MIPALVLLVATSTAPLSGPAVTLYRDLATCIGEIDGLAIDLAAKGLELDQCHTARARVEVRAVTAPPVIVRPALWPAPVGAALGAGAGLLVCLDDRCPSPLGAVLGAAVGGFVAVLLDAL